MKNSAEKRLEEQKQILAQQKEILRNQKEKLDNLKNYQQYNQNQVRAYDPQAGDPYRQPYPAKYLKLPYDQPYQGQYPQTPYNQQIDYQRRHSGPIVYKIKEENSINPGAVGAAIGIGAGLLAGYMFGGYRRPFYGPPPMPYYRPYGYWGWW